MGNLVEDYLAIYEVALKGTNVERTRDARIKLAHQRAGVECPQGQHALHVYMDKQNNTDEIKASAVYQTGRSIVAGLRVLNNAVLGSNGAHSNGASAAPEHAQQPAPAPAQRVKLISFKTAPQHQRGRWDSLYSAWATEHDIVPSDAALNHFVGPSRSTWSLARAHCVKLGFVFTSIPGGQGTWQVTRRPKVTK